jgi:hypothetical protein
MRAAFQQHSILVLAMAQLLAACAHPGPSGPQSVCGTPGFPYVGGWLGGDAGYSVPLAPGESLWLFGDSFVAAAELETRIGSTFVHNTIGLSRCHPGGPWQIEYHWTPAHGSEPASAFIPADDPDHYWWIFDGFVFEEALHLGLLGVESAAPRGPLELPFQFSGMKLARVENFRAPPEEWRVELLDLSDDRRAIPGSSMVVHADHVYFFTFIDVDGSHYPRMLTRIPLSALTQRSRDPGQRLEYLADDGTWRPGIDADSARILMDDDASEMSVRFHPEIDRWLAIYGYPSLRPGFPEVPPSDAIYARTAERLEGPWTAPHPIFHMPELAPASRTDPNTFCYAAKEHPQLAREGEIFITYVCNLFTPPGDDAIAIMQRLFVAMDLYRPVVVTLPVEVVLPPGH